MCSSNKTIRDWLLHCLLKGLPLALAWTEERYSCIQPIQNEQSCIWTASMPSVNRSVLLVCPPLHEYCPICFHPGLLKFWISLLWNVITFWNQGPSFSLCFELLSHWSLRQVSKDHWSSGSFEFLQVFLGRLFLPVLLLSLHLQDNEDLALSKIRAYVCSHWLWKPNLN